MNEEKISDDIITSEETRTIYLHSLIDQNVSSTICSTIDKLDREQGNIYIDINSEGGVLCCATSIVGTMKRAKSPIITRINGVASSAASFIALSGDKVEMNKLGVLILHNIIYSLDETPKAEAEDYFNNGEIIFKLLVENLFKKTKVTMKRFYSETNRKSWYIMAEEALSLKLINKIY